MKTTDVLVIGAGPTGLTMANLLSLSGVSVRIVDKKSGPAEESRALVVHAKTLELLDRLDLAEQAVNTGQKLRAIELLHNGKRSGKISFMSGDDLTPYPFALIYTQDQTERLLLHNLDKTAVQVEWGTELLSMEQTPAGTRAIIRQSNGQEETIEATWIIGADGAHSPVRHSLTLDFTGESYKQALFLADLELEGNVQADQVSMSITQLGFIGFFPMPGERRFRIISTLPLELTDRETLTCDEVQQVLNTYKGLHVTITRAHWISVYRTHHRISKRFQVGHVFLVGDAAHIHSPAGGQGMNTGIGDAYNLAWKLALVIKGQAHAALLDSYEAERIPFARAILHGSDRAFELMTMSQPIVQQLKIFGLPRIFRIVSSLPVFRQQAFWLVSQLWTSYRNSPVVAQSGSLKKGVQAGDRAPYGSYEVGPDAGKSIFTRLKSLDLHLLLFEGSEPATAGITLQDLETNLRTLMSTYVAPIHVQVVATGNHQLHQRYSVTTPEVFLVRPDGHIAYRGSAEDSASLASYLDRLFNKSHHPVPLNSEGVNIQETPTQG